ncbi:Ppx/GppA phosphatase family protein [Rhizosaccharibacter radicis]|uniref:Ppx/GppA family phosphatase n=1 Tax=Rhizosaccharibacter radicis TaxID=2782605 RepID=A0ABT1VWX2_9PROT|nr:Ppx/GppA family phosphatase [Acetobacteraceae bacterium KSS12]
MSFAALDLGTNNCRLLIAAPTRDGEFRVLDSFSRIVRLGEGLQNSGQLSPAAMDRTLDALRICASRLSRRPIHGLRAVATEACRRAGNGRTFLDRVKRETGLFFEVISTREEAELALESCSALLHAPPGGFPRASLRARGVREPEAPPPERALLFDIGGGSTEIAWIRLDRDAGGRPAQTLIGYHSIPVGVVTLFEQFGESVFEPDGYAAMVDHVTDRLRPFEAVHCIAREVRRGTVRLLGTSGTVTTLASVALDLPRYNRSQVDGTMLDRMDAAAAIRTLRRLGPDGLRRHPCVGPERIGSVLPGCAIFDAIHRLWPTAEVAVADRGLRDGLLLRMMRKEDLRAAPTPRRAVRRPAPVRRGDWNGFPAAAAP